MSATNRGATRRESDFRVAKEREPHMIERLKKDMQKIRGGAGK